MQFNKKSVLLLLFFLNIFISIVPAHASITEHCQTLLTNIVSKYDFDSSGSALAEYEEALLRYQALKSDDRFIAVEQDLRKSKNLETEISYLAAFADSYLTSENGLYGMLHDQGRVRFKRKWFSHLQMGAGRFKTVLFKHVQWSIGRLPWSKPQITVPAFKTYSREEIVERIFQITVALKELRLTNSFWPRKRFGFNSFPLCIVGRSKACPKEAEGNEDDEAKPKEYYKLPLIPLGVQSSSQFSKAVMSQVQKYDSVIANVAIQFEHILPSWKAKLLERDPHAWLQFSEILKPLSVIGSAVAFDYFVDFPLFSILDTALVGSAITFLVIYSPLGNHQVSRQNLEDPDYQPRGLRPRLHAYWYKSNVMRATLLSMAAAMAMAVPQSIENIQKIPQMLNEMKAQGAVIAQEVNPAEMGQAIVDNIPKHAKDLQIRYTLEIGEIETILKDDPQNQELQRRLRVKKNSLQQLIEDHGDLRS